MPPQGFQGEMREHEVARALTWLGYPVSMKQRRQIWVKVDLDKTGMISQNEFLKFIRFLRETEIEAVKSFLEAHSDESVLRERELKDMLGKLGYAPPQPLFQQALKISQDSSGDGNVDLRGILGVLNFIRQGQVKKLRQSAGLPDHQAAKVISKFGMKTDAGKKITLDEFQKFMYTLFKDARQSIDEQDRIKKIIQEHSVKGGLDLNSAFWVVRTYADMREEDSWRREQAVAQEANFTLAQVAHYRETFYEMGGNTNNYLNQDQAYAAFNQLMKLSKIQVKILRNEFEESGDNAERIDFAEFLHLIGVVLGVITH
jgi:Ca2+-binding EF-hand superfamily protein